MRIGLLLLFLTLPALAAGGPWISFKTGEIGSFGKVTYQLDPASIRSEGAYRTFIARAWRTEQKQPLAFSINEQLYFLSQKYAVDCPHKRFASRFIDSNMPAQKKRVATPDRMDWVDLKRVPAVALTVCGEK